MPTPSAARLARPPRRTSGAYPRSPRPRGRARVRSRATHAAPTSRRGPAGRRESRGRPGPPRTARAGPSLPLPWDDVPLAAGAGVGAHVLLTLERAVHPVPRLAPTHVRAARREVVHEAPAPD